MGALSGHHAVVTGGGRGIGRACAAALSLAGATVTVIGRTEKTLRDAVNAKHAAGYAVADVTDEKLFFQAIQSAAKERGPVDLFVANAGGAESAPFGKTSPDLFRKLFELNTLSVVHGAHAVLGDMVARGFGRIVVVASTAGLHGSPYISAYVKVHKQSKEARRQAGLLLRPFEEHLRMVALGQISEIADADLPNEPRGCVAQAWSIGELLRAAVEDVYEIPLSAGAEAILTKS